MINKFDTQKKIISTEKNDHEAISRLIYVKLLSTHDVVTCFVSNTAKNEITTIKCSLTKYGNAIYISALFFYVINHCQFQLGKVHRTSVMDIPVYSHNDLSVDELIVAVSFECNIDTTKCSPKPVWEV